MNRKILFISPTNVADHRRGGASICSLAYLQALAACASGGVILVSPCARDELPELPEGVLDVIKIPERNAWQKGWHLAAHGAVDRLSPFIDQLIGRMDLTRTTVFLNSSRAGRFARRLAARRVPVISLFHNVEELYYRASETSPLKRWALATAARGNDRMAFEWSSASVFLTRFDSDHMRGQASQRRPGARTEIDGFFAPEPRPEEPDRALAPSAEKVLLVNCSLGIPQNTPGIRMFLERCWRSWSGAGALADATVVLAGAKPDPQILELARQLPRVSVVADPPDEQMEVLFARCRVCISTIDSGSGIKVRVAEALRRGRPVLATPHSCVGYEGIDPRVLRCADVGKMGHALNELIVSSVPGQLEALARAEFERRLSFREGRRRIDALLTAVEAADAAGPFRTVGAAGAPRSARWTSQ